MATPAVPGARGVPEVRATHGSIETYFADGLGIEVPGIAALRAAFTEPA